MLWSYAWDLSHMPWMLFGPMMMLVLLAVCIGVAYGVARGLPVHERHPLEILRERYARGEINLGAGKPDPSQSFSQRLVEWRLSVRDGNLRLPLVDREPRQPVAA